LGINPFFDLIPSVPHEGKGVQAENESTEYGVDMSTHTNYRGVGRGGGGADSRSGQRVCGGRAWVSSKARCWTSLDYCAEWIYGASREKREGKRRKRKKGHGLPRGFWPKMVQGKRKAFLFFKLFINCKVI
jgi:hypothetical protein